jgi:dTDP-glucose 4,6-dehydratase
MPDLKNVLVTGGAGFIGSNFVRHLLAAEGTRRVVTLDALTYSGSRENLRNLPRPELHVFFQGNICDADLVERLLHEHEIDTIVHFAAETHVDRSILDPGLFIQTNVIGTFTLLEAARKTWIEDGKYDSGKYRFHHVSTDEVFGSLSPDQAAWDENVAYSPNSPYAASKAASDHLVRAYGHTYGLPYTITNCSNNYGPYQFPEKLIPLMILNAIDGKSLPIYGDGKQIRDWLYVEDHCEAIWQVLRNGKTGESYNVGGNCQPANLEIVDTLCDILDEIKPNSPFKPHGGLKTFVADRPGHDRRYAMDIGKIRSELGWEPKHDLREGLLKTVEWYLEHGEWIDKIRKQEDYQAWLNKNYSERKEGGI